MTTMEALSRIEEGQREMGRTLIEGQKDITAGQKEIAKMVSEGFKESEYWLSLIDTEGDGDLEQERISLKDEALELVKIFNAILKKSS